MVRWLYLFTDNLDWLYPFTVVGYVVFSFKYFKTLKKILYLYATLVFSCKCRSIICFDFIKCRPIFKPLYLVRVVGMVTHNSVF